MENRTRLFMIRRGARAAGFGQFHRLEFGGGEYIGYDFRLFELVKLLLGKTRLPHQLK